MRARLARLLVVLALVLAGCTVPDAPDARTVPSSGDGRTTLPTSPPEARAPCGQFTVHVEPSPLTVVGAPVSLVARFASCDERTLQVQTSGCAPAVEHAFERGGASWRLENGTAVLTPPTCPLDLWGPPAVLIEPGGTFEERMPWTGSFTSDPCADWHPRGGGCPQLDHPGGAHRVLASLVVEDARFEAESFPSFGPPREPSRDVVPDCGLTVRVEPARIRPGEEATLTARFVNCGEADVRFDAHRCGGPHEVDAWLGNASARVLSPAGGAARGAGLERVCTSDVLPPRLVFPGGFLEMRWGWNGTWMDHGAHGASYRDAAPGAYAVGAVASPIDASPWEAEASVEVLTRA